MKGHGCFFKSQDSGRFGGRPRIFATCVEMILQAGNHNLEGYLCDISKEILLIVNLYNDGQAGAELQSTSTMSPLFGTSTNCKVRKSQVQFVLRIIPRTEQNRSAR